MSRPNRSDAHLSPEDEATREAEVREYFDDAAPKRHTKPSRSEHSAVYTDALVPDDGGTSHPELDKFQELEAHTERLVYEGGKAGEEFVETEYYKDLGGVGKQHHTVATAFFFRTHLASISNFPCMVLSFNLTMSCCYPLLICCESRDISLCNCKYRAREQTGTGFIKMDKAQGASFKLAQDPDATERHASCKGNPATNEWIPSADTVYPASDKPSRSDS